MNPDTTPTNALFAAFLFSAEAVGATARLGNHPNADIASVIIDSAGHAESQWRLKYR